MLIFLQSLLSSGVPIVDPGDEKVGLWIQAQLLEPPDPLHKLLKSLHQQEASAFPGPALDYHPAASLWALRFFFRSSCYYLFREIEVSEIEAGLAEPMPDPDSPEAHLSAHLVLRHLPKLIQMTRSIADGDPLVKALQTIALGLPYSCPTLMNADTQLDPLFKNHALAQSWLENLIAAQLPLPDDPRVEELLTQFSGLHRQKILPSRYHSKISS